MQASGRLTGWWLPGSLALAGAVFAALTGSSVLLDAGVFFFYYLLLAASWNLLAGYSGQMSFMHVAFAVAGAYGTAAIHGWLSLPVWASLLAAALLVGIAAVAVGFLTMRFRNITFSLATFAIAGMFVSWLTGASAVTGGNSGLSVDPLLDGDQTRSFVWIGLALAVSFYAAQASLLTSTWGVLLRAVRDHEEVARGLGVRTTALKIGCFTFAAVWAALAGGFFATYVGFITPSIGTLSNMGLVIAMVVVGGMGRAGGPVVGTLVFRIVDYFTRGYGGEYTVLVFATLLLFMMLFMRDGITGLFDRWFSAMRPRRDRWATPTSTR